jgi:hypothetical protein
LGNRTASGYTESVLRAHVRQHSHMPTWRKGTITKYQMDKAWVEKKNRSQGSIKSDMEGSASRLPRTTFQMNTHRLIIRLSAFPQPDKMFRFQFYLVSCSKLPLLKESSRLSRDKYSLLYQPFIIFHYAFLSILNTCKQRFS